MQIKASRQIYAAEEVEPGVRVGVIVRAVVHEDGLCVAEVYVLGAKFGVDLAAGEEEAKEYEQMGWVEEVEARADDRG